MKKLGGDPHILRGSAKGTRGECIYRRGEIRLRVGGKGRRVLLSKKLGVGQKLREKSWDGEMILSSLKLPGGDLKKGLLEGTGARAKATEKALREKKEGQSGTCRDPETEPLASEGVRETVPFIKIQNWGPRRGKRPQEPSKALGKAR